MAEETTYFALIDDYSSRERPGGLVRRIKHDNGQRDEAFTHNGGWRATSVLYDFERGDTQNELIPIDADEAERIVERIKKTAGAP